MALLKAPAGGRSIYEHFTQGPATALFASLLLISTQCDVFGQAARIPDYQVKAVFLFNFAQFVSWPSPESADTPFVIGILGDDPFGSYLDETVRGEKVNNRSLIIQRYRHGTEPRNCHILFVSASERERTAQILSNLKGRSVLTVSDIEGFAGLGGMVELFTERSKIRMRINLEAVKAANLKISSKLLRVAELTR